MGNPYYWRCYLLSDIQLARVDEVCNRFQMGSLAFPRKNPYLLNQKKCKNDGIKGVISGGSHISWFT
jgi:hypothetical protein